MTQQFNFRPPISSPITDSKNMLTSDWQAFYRQLFLFFQDQFGPLSVRLPDVNNDELSKLPTSTPGYITYNSETDEFLVLKKTGWKTITTS